MRAALAFLTLLTPLAVAYPNAAPAAEIPEALVRSEPGYATPGRGAAGTVRARPRPDYDPAGLPVGGLRAYPKIAVATAYDSNILRSAAGGESDLVTRVSPAIRLESDWNRHRLVLATTADLGLYARRASENYADAQAEATGVIDIQRGLRLEATADLARRHEERGSIDGDGGTEPVTVLQWNGRAAIAGDRGRFDYRVGADYTRADYRDVPALAGGVLNQDDRDHQTFAGFARLGYRAWPDGGVYLAGRVGRTDYVAARDDSGTNRDSQNQSLIGGAAMDWGGITFGQLYAGWFAEQYEDAALSDVSGIVAGAELTANLTPLTTLTLGASRAVQPTVTTGAASFIQNEIRVGVDHELLRNLLLGAAAQGRRLTLEGIDRTDDYWAAGVSAEWLLNRYARLRLRYDFDLRNSHGAVAVDGWRRHVAGLSVLLQR